MKKVLAILLLLVLVCASLVACNNNPPADQSEVSEVSKEEEHVLFSNLPDVNYAEGGNPSEFVILTIGDWANAYKSVEIVAHEQAPEILQDAVTERNARVEERFGVKITEIRTASTGAMLTDIQNNAALGEDKYDVVMPYMTDAATLAVEGLFYDLNSEGDIAFDGPWWDQAARETLSIDDKLFFITGDLCLLAYDCTHCLVFNRDMAEENDVDPYKLVYDGEWTLDKML